MYDQLDKYRNEEMEKVSSRPEQVPTNAHAQRQSPALRAQNGRNR